MTATQKTLVIRPADVPGLLFGESSATAYIVGVTAVYDRPIAVDGLWIDQFETPATLADDGQSWRIAVYCNDDPAVTAGQGFKVRVRLLAGPKQGLHSKERTWTLDVAPMLASPDEIPVVPAEAPVGMPSWWNPASLDPALTPDATKYLRYDAATRQWTSVGVEQIAELQDSFNRQVGQIASLEGNVTSLTAQLAEAQDAYRQATAPTPAMPMMPDGTLYGDVAGNVSTLVADGSDQDVYPDRIPLKGTITFTPVVASKYVVHMPTGDLIYAKPITVPIGPDGSFSTRLVATENPDLFPTGWEYDVLYKPDSGDELKMHITVPAKTTSTLGNLALQTHVTAGGDDYVWQGTGDPTPYTPGSTYIDQASGNVWVYSKEA